MSPMLRYMLLATALALPVLATPVLADTMAQAAPQAAPPDGMKTATFTQDELKSFAAASVRVEQINNKWKPKITDAQGKPEQEKLRKQAMGEMVEAVQGKGLTVQRYNLIVLAMRTNPDIARTVESLRAAQP